ncbi:MAG: BREX system ATP-binding domain-containing protein [Armatimonadota bacterium]
MSNHLVEKRRAIEALRAGVPNRDAVRELPPLQLDINASFEQLLVAVSESSDTASIVNGLLLLGDFGTGKSHWLEYFRHVALEAKFVVSSVVLNKETPLNDLKKVYRTCVESAVVSEKNGPALSEIALKYHSDRAPLYDELFKWVNTTPDLDPRFAATLQLLVKSNDPDVIDQIVDDWTGIPMRSPNIRKALNTVGEKGVSVGRPKKDHELQRFEFLSRFFRSAGYKGWLILFDEGEIIARYSLRQRARAYAHLSQLFNHVNPRDGLAVVLAMSNDYIGQILYGRNDRDNIRAKLELTRDAAIVPLAEQGMDIIQRNGYLIHGYTPEQVDDVYRCVRSLYADAYSWATPDLEQRPEVLPSDSMRKHIRTWINAWDFRRLYDISVDLVAEEITPNYDEDVDLQTNTGDEELDMQNNTDDEPTITL